MSSLWQGFILGFSIAAPVGPIGVLCIRRTLAHGRMHGFVSGLGAATADAIYGLIAACGMTVMMNALLDQRLLLQTAGGLFLLYLAYRTFRSASPEVTGTAERKPLAGDYWSTLGLTITNPMTILMFLGFMAGTGIGGGSGSGTLASALLLVAGVFAGSVAWWIFLSQFVGIWQSRLRVYMPWINRLSGIVLAGFGVCSLVSVVTAY